LLALRAWSVLSAGQQGSSPGRPPHAHPVPAWQQPDQTIGGGKAVAARTIQGKKKNRFTPCCPGPGVPPFPSTSPHGPVGDCPTRLTPSCQPPVRILPAGQPAGGPCQSAGRRMTTRIRGGSCTSLYPP